MLIDLHTHTKPCSDCARMTAAELVEEAMRQGLDAVCVTDHYVAWGGRDAQALSRERYGFPVLRGVETTTTLGDVLVFGLDEDFADGCDGPELLRHVHECGGASVLAHPFRRNNGWGFVYWLEQHGLAVDGALAALPELQHIHAVETYNGTTFGEELAQAEALAGSLGLPATGGSDAHAARDVGRTVTEFEHAIADEAALVAAIRAGRMRPRRMR